MLSGYPLLREALDIGFRLTSMKINGNINLSDARQLVVYYYCVQSNKILLSSCCILASPLGEKLYSPVKILARSLFEHCVRLKYLDAHPEQMIQLIKRSGSCPNRPFGNLREMCEEFGMLDLYQTMYVETSQVAHGGTFPLFVEYARMYGYLEVVDWDLTRDLWMGIVCYVDLLGVVSKSFRSARIADDLVDQHP